ncbi:MAG: hypothetical protein HC880_14400 [Bacteroidia bacterium]|nr:hypothetical protein [Bacteroidia bacterium]
MNTNHQDIKNEENFEDLFDELELDFGEMSESMVISNDPFVRYGIWFISGLVILLITISAFFKYPDTVKGRFQITSKSPPITIKAIKSSRVNHSLVKEGAAIKE